MAELGLPTDVGSPSPQEIINDDVAEGRSTLDLELTGSTTNGRRDDLHTEAIKQQSPGPPKPERRSCEIILAQGKAIDEDAIRKRGLAVIVPPVQQCWEYMVFEDGIEVEEILEEYDDAGLIEYLVQFADGREDVVSFDELIKFGNGRTLLADFSYQRSGYSDSAEPALAEPSRRSGRPRPSRNYNLSSLIMSSDDDELSAVILSSKGQTRNRRLLTVPKTAVSNRSSRQRNSQSQVSLVSMSSRSSSDGYGQGKKRRSAARTRGERAPRAATQRKVNYSDIPAFEDLDDESDVDISRLGKRKRSSIDPGRSRKLLRGSQRRDSPVGARRSGRNTALRDTQEVGEDDIPETATNNAVTRFVGAKEFFRALSSEDDFRIRHCQTCDTCYEDGDNEEKGLLVYCQGCTLSYHQKCLGKGTSREHLVTKIGEKNSVLQCRRCVGFSKQKDPLSPDQGLCMSCHEPGSSTTAFRERKTPSQEQKERENNNGIDPVTDILPDLINNSQQVLFRCMECYRACHLYHLPAKIGAIGDLDEEEAALARFEEYSRNWTCKDCLDKPADVVALVAWRPTDSENYKSGRTADEVREDEKDYLVRFKKLSYSKVQWKPGAWVWGVTAPAMRKAFFKRDNGYNLPKMTTQDAVPEEYLRVDIVFDVEYTNLVKQSTEKIAKARVKEVKRALVKFKGLGYEDVLWEEPPPQEDGGRWDDFKTAYEDWVMGSFIHPPAPKTLEANITRVRSQNFAQKLELKNQPESLTGGELMEYQMQGLNWLYYQWHRCQNAILADEMGLGKTIQIIGFLATLKQFHGCWPFLIVVPNSTCPNWRREIKQWAPSLRVVMYYGSAESRRLASRHELFPGGAKELRCHIVVTSYDAAQEDEFRRIFKYVHWAGLVVDEGQRLKNDESILYGSLNALKIPFKVLLTGTPLQNNPRELFNLLQFLDSANNAQSLEEEYATLTKENVPRLHELLKPFFLRRTKVGVLSFLPPLAQIIIPVSMTLLQKKLYKSILAKNPELIKSIIGSKKSLKQTERANLNNILMQLRKCLCHPFVYSRDIEERSNDDVISHRNLVEASSKLQLLEIMLPKLQERGHRVLIFSQFLDMLDMVEDFLDGLGVYHQRLDGNMNSLQKQKRIDEFNAPDSQIFAFLLSTRAGGVGINLATADTVIILDPDFNPHQDIQALSRAHRIGQKKKVLVFQLITRATAEEKIMQIGKKKMALDHVLIEQMDADDDAGLDLESILKYGTEALFNDDHTQDIHYDSSSVDRLLDRSQVENTDTGKDTSAESQFSFARVWANDKGILEDAMAESDESHEVDLSVWENILKEREREAAAEAAAKAEDLGRGRRKRQTVDYSKQTDRDLDYPPAQRKRKQAQQSDSDTDFQEREESEVESEDEATADIHELITTPPPFEQSSNHLKEYPEPHNEKATQSRLERITNGSGEDPGPHIRKATQARLDRGEKGSYDDPDPHNRKAREFKRAEVPLMTHHPLPSQNDAEGPMDRRIKCPACAKYHEPGQCPLKRAGAEFCNLCGLSHYGNARVCPHMNSVTQLRAMNEALKQSPEPIELIEIARKKVVGLIGNLRHRKKSEKEAQAAKESQVLQPSVQPDSNLYFRLDGADVRNIQPEYVNGGGSGKENRSFPYSTHPHLRQ